MIDINKMIEEITERLIEIKDYTRHDKKLNKEWKLLFRIQGLLIKLKKHYRNEQYD